MLSAKTLEEYKSENDTFFVRKGVGGLRIFPKKKMDFEEKIRIILAG